MATTEFEKTAEATATAEKAEVIEKVDEEEVTEVDGWAPSVSLEVNDRIETGEEDEQELYRQRSKLYRWISKDEGSGEWKERGTGEMRLLKEKKSGRVRALMRQEKTLKIIANHYVVENGPYCSLKPNAGSQKCWVWMASDYAEGEQRTEQFALKFGNPELAQAFEKAFNEAKQENAKIISGEKTKKNEAAEKEEKEEEDEKKKEE